MNREIKFRAWDKKNKRMFDVCEIRFYPSSMVWDSDRLIGIQDFELMQYTGLKDKNEKEIYEGDIVKDEGEYSKLHHKVDIVEFSMKHGGFRPFTWDGGCGCCNSYLLDSNEVIVIGNIFENPDLLPKQP